MVHYGLFGGVPATDDPALLAKIEGYRRGLSQVRVEGASPTWVVGRARLRDADVDMPITWKDLVRDVEWSAGILELAGVGKGDIAFYSLMYSQSAQFWPFMQAGFDLGGCMASGMPTAWDAYRLEMYLRLYEMKLLLGVAEPTLDGLEAGGHDLGKVMGRAGRLVAYAGAWERLTAAGLKPWRATWLGPILAIDPCDGSGGRIDTRQWTLEEADGQILISCEGRATTFDRAATGVAGKLATIDGEQRFVAA